MIGFISAGTQMFASCKSVGKGADTTQVAMVEQNNILTDQEKADGWILMFDGQTFNGWRGYNKPAFPDSGWEAVDGTLHCIGSGQGEAGGKGGDILYDRKFKDFHLSLEWKIDTAGNSGIFYLGQELPGEPIWKSAPEMQILDSNHIDYSLGINGNRQAGALYDLIPTKVPCKMAGEWNKVEILVSQGTVVHKVNGQVGLEYHLGTADWDNLVKGKDSKFKDFPEFGKYKEGFICLQDHGNNVWFRNIKIKPM
jgi:hypothetical protein